MIAMKLLAHKIIMPLAMLQKILQERKARSEFGCCSKFVGLTWMLFKVKMKLQFQCTVVASMLGLIKKKRLILGAAHPRLLLGET